MADQALILASDDGETVARMIELVTDSVSSPSTKRNYARSLRDFLTWYRETGQQQFNKATVQRYAAEMDAWGYSAANINQRLSAIRKLAREAADNGAMPENLAHGIKAVQGKRQEGRRAGNWLIKDQAERLLHAPSKDTLKGLRDRAILGVFLGCGLRRQELAELTFDRIQLRDARWVIVDLVGKRGKVRTVPMPSWTKALIDRWAKVAGISTGRIFRPINKGGNLSGDTMTPQAIYMALSEYVQACNLGDVAPHDLRRTFAKLAHKGGAPIEQIQLSLGHTSVQTTERYLGVEQNLTDAPCDHLGLKVEL